MFKILPKHWSTDYASCRWIKCFRKSAHLLLHSHFENQASFAQTFKKHYSKGEVELGNCQELRRGHGNLLSYQIWFSQQLLYLKPSFTEFIWLWWQTHETVNEREEEGRKRLLGKLKAEFCCLRNRHLKKVYLCQIFNSFDGVPQIYSVFSSFRSLWKVSYWSPSRSTPRTTTKKTYKKQGHNYYSFYWRTNLCIHELVVNRKTFTHK